MAVARLFLAIQSSKRHFEALAELPHARFPHETISDHAFFFGELQCGPGARRWLGPVRPVPREPPARASLCTRSPSAAEAPGAADRPALRSWQNWFPSWQTSPILWHIKKVQTCTIG